MRDIIFFAEKIFDDTVFYFIRDSLALQQAALYFLRLLRHAGGHLDLLTNLGWPELCLSIQALTLTIVLFILIIDLSVWSNRTTQLEETLELIITWHVQHPSKNPTCVYKHKIAASCCFRNWCQATCNLARNTASCDREQRSMFQSRNPFYYLITASKRTCFEIREFVLATYM